MREPLHSGSTCLIRHSLSSLDMHGMEGFAAMLDVKTDRIHNAVSVSNYIGD